MKRKLRNNMEFFNLLISKFNIVEIYKSYGMGVIFDKVPKGSIVFVRAMPYSDGIKRLIVEDYHDFLAGLYTSPEDTDLQIYLREQGKDTIQCPMASMVSVFKYGKWLGDELKHIMRVSDVVQAVTQFIKDVDVQFIYADGNRNSIVSAFNGSFVVGSDFAVWNKGAFNEAKDELCKTLRMLGLNNCNCLGVDRADENAVSKLYPSIEKVYMKNHWLIV